MWKAFCNWRVKWCAKMAIRSMNVMDYRGAHKWLRIAKRWERLAAR
jgi:hypothetical protein